MQARLIELHQQRGRLLERIAFQRQTLAREFEPLKLPLSLPGRLASRLREGQLFVREHPYLVGTLVTAIVVLKPRFILRWAQRGLLVWRTWRSLRGMLPPSVFPILRSALRQRPRG
jgi:hypothetical protein